MLEWLDHGGDWVTFAERYPEQAANGIDFSANINPLGPPAAVHDVWKELIPFLSRYPDARQRRLREQLAEKHGISAQMLLVTNGGAEAIDLIVRAIGPNKVGVIEPCFSEYRQAAARAGAEVVQRIVTESAEGFAIPFFLAEQLLREVDLLILGNPNNPTGALWGRSQLLALAELAGQYNCHLLLDEAFLDFLPQEEHISMIAAVPWLSHVTVVRSMTKMYAIPGLRLGYLVANQQLVERCQQLQTPWSVNGIAEQIGQVLVKDEDFVQRTRQWLEQERRWLAAAMENLANREGIRLVPMQAGVNYLLLGLELPEWNDLRLQKRLAEEGIFIRACRTFPGMGDRYVRIAVRSREENQRLVQAMERMDWEETNQLK